MSERQKNEQRRDLSDGPEETPIQRGLFPPPPEASLNPLRNMVSHARAYIGPEALNPVIAVQRENPEVAQEIRARFGFEQPLAPKILAARGYECDEKLEFRLNPSLSSLPDIREMKNGGAIVDHIVTCIKTGRPLLVATDFDNDGIISNLIATHYARSIGFDRIHSAIPVRAEHGYGLTRKFFNLHNEALIQRYGDIHKSLLTADFGTTNKKEILLARAHGCWVGVLDHHHVGDVDCPAILGNPGQTGCGFENNVLAANGLMLLTMMGVHEELQRQGRVGADVDLYDYLVPVAIATLADCVPLEGASWTLAYHGLRRFDDSPFPVFREMLKRRNVTGTPKGSDLSMLLAPMINAPGRLGDANFMVEALATSDPEEARRTAERLYHINHRRQEIAAMMLDEALSMLPSDPNDLPRFLCLMGDQFQEHAGGECSGFHKGVVGIVCQRLVDRYLRPVGLFANYDGVASGSFRSIPGYNMIENLKNCENLFLKVGGHPAAAGGSIHAQDHEALAEKLHESVKCQFGEEYTPVSWEVDDICALQDLTPDAVRELSRFEPFGTANPEPTVLIENLFVHQVKRFGQIEDHLSITFSDGNREIDGMMWRTSDHKALRQGGRVHVVATPTLSKDGRSVRTYRKESSLTL
jgi:single-stranded-DNA-specific exonuclease